jgi:stage IV sporulation protein B
MKNRKYRLISAVCLFALIFCAAVPSFRSNINETVTFAAYGSGKLDGARISSRFYELICGEEAVACSASNTEERQYLIPGGDVFGIKIKGTKLSVVEADTALGLCEGDILISVNGEAVQSLDRLKSILASCGGERLNLVFERSGEQIVRAVTPQKVGDEWRIGILLRDGAAGIGTVTYINPEDCSFGGLGHGICETDGKDTVEIKSGTVSGVILGGVKKGESGKPGELSGILNNKCHGELYLNTECGVFGKFDKEKIENKLKEEAYPVAHKSEVKEGKAQIISTVKGGMKAAYDVEITKISDKAESTKSFKIKVTDPTLIAITGGIVKGMSGSPIIQDGKLVGAVTHVMIADPTEGYGIFIENMLSAANEGALPKVA